jgi:hypothetical protein
MKSTSPKLRNLLPALAALAFAVGLLLGGTALAQTYVVNTEGAVLREGSSNTKTQIRPLVKGEKVIKLAVERGFFKVKTDTDQKEGYVSQVLLSEVAETKMEVPSFEDFMDNLKADEARKTTPKPGRYYFENIFEYLGAQNQPRFGLVLSIVIAVIIAVMGGYLTARVPAGLERVLPDGLQEARRTAAKIILTAVCAYPVLSATAYFLDLTLHYCVMVESSALIKLFTVPRVIIAAPLALADAFTGNWFIALAALIGFGLIVHPALRGRAAAPAGDLNASGVSVPSKTVPRPPTRPRVKSEGPPAGNPGREPSGVFPEDPGGLKETRIVANEDDKK